MSEELDPERLTYHETYVYNRMHELAKELNCTLRVFAMNPPRPEKIYFSKDTDFEKFE